MTIKRWKVPIRGIKKDGANYGTKETEGGIDNGGTKEGPDTNKSNNGWDDLLDMNLSSDSAGNVEAKQEDISIQIVGEDKAPEVQEIQPPNQQGGQDKTPTSPISEIQVDNTNTPSFSLPDISIDLTSTFQVEQN